MQQPPPNTLRIEISARSIALILGAIAGIWLLYELRVVWLILILALILAGTFHPLIKWIESRGLRRIPALIVLFVAMSLIALLFVFLTVPPLVDQVSQLVQNAPLLRTRLIAMLGEHSLTLPLADIVQRANVDEMFGAVGGFVIGNSSLAARVVGYGATTLVLSFYLLADGDRAHAVIYGITPRTSHARLTRVLARLENIVGGYMRGQLITSAAIGVFAFVLLAAMSVPDALTLALFAAVVDVLPFIGGFCVIVPAVLSALSRGVPTALIVLAALLVYMEFESRILVPRVYGRVLRLSSTVVILALVAGGTLMGILGALLALPIAAGLIMILEEFHIELPSENVEEMTVR